MRRLLAVAVLLGAASCQAPVMPGPETAMAPTAAPEPAVAEPGPIPLTQTPPPIAAAPAPAAPVVPPPPPPVAVGEARLAAVPPPAFALFPRPATPGRLALSNFTYERATVETVITAAPDCETRDPNTVVTDIRLPLNATRTVVAPPGTDVCWRRQYEPSRGEKPGWSDWNRAYLSIAGRVDAQL